MSRAENVKKKTAEMQERFLQALEKRMLNVSAACEVAGCTRMSAYNWKNKDEAFAQRWHDVEENFYDKLETTMFAKALSEQDNTMLIWLSKTKMKHRGYVEKTEIDANVNTFEQFMRSLPDNPEDLDKK